MLVGIGTLFGVHLRCVFFVVLQWLLIISCHIVSSFILFDNSTWSSSNTSKISCVLFCCNY